MARYARYQGAILQDDHILLIRHEDRADGRTYWVVPGGGREANESEHEAIIREMQEETNLQVRVERLLLDEPPMRKGGVYQRYKTYLCTPIGGEAAPGHEPEFDETEGYIIAEVRWFDLRDEASWDMDRMSTEFTLPLLNQIREELGYI